MTSAHFLEVAIPSLVSGAILSSALTLGLVLGCAFVVSSLEYASECAAAATLAAQATRPQQQQDRQPRSLQAYMKIGGVRAPAQGPFAAAADPLLAAWLVGFVVAVVALAGAWTPAGWLGGLAGWAVAGVVSWSVWSSGGRGPEDGLGLRSATVGGLFASAGASRSFGDDGL
jgi:hypothetical protein